MCFMEIIGVGEEIVNHGKRNGPHKEWSVDGVLLESSTYIDDEPDGEYAEWWENGICANNLTL